MVDPSEENQASRASPKRVSIVAAARRLFLEGGYGATSMDTIASEAGVSKHTVYSHFHDKERLFGAVIGDLCRDLGGPGPNDLASNATPDQVLGVLGRKILGGILMPQAIDLFRVVLAEIGRFPELGEVLWRSGPEQLQEGLGGYLMELDKRGILSVPDADLAARQFIEMVKGPYFMPLLFGLGDPPTPDEIERAVDQAVSVFLGGLKPTASPT